MRRKEGKILPWLRRGTALLTGCLTLYLSCLTVRSAGVGEALRAVSEGALTRAVLRWELGDFGGDGELSFAAAMALHPVPQLRRESAADEEETAETATPAESAPPQETAAVSFAEKIEDNGVPARTLLPVQSRSYLRVGDVYISTSTAYTEADIGYDGSFAAHLSAGEEPQVLIYHTHGSEAYTPPAGEEYESSGDHRTRDSEANVVRVGEELAQVLSARGIGVIHDRTLYDDPDYNEAYERSRRGVEAYLEKYPTIRLVLDIHRDAVSDGSGNICKVLADEGENSPAQMTLVMGSDAGGLAYPAWRDNLHLAIALQQAIGEEHPTLMRPLLLRKSRYNQHLSAGALLIEVGAAGNSLAEALAAVRILGEELAALTLS